jgi:hypothetical protein
MTMRADHAPLVAALDICTRALAAATAREAAAIGDAKARGLNTDAILADATVRLAVRDYQKVFADFIAAEIALDPPSRRTKRSDETAPF